MLIDEHTKAGSGGRLTDVSSLSEPSLFKFRINRGARSILVGSASISSTVLYSRLTLNSTH